MITHSSETDMEQQSQHIRVHQTFKHFSMELRLAFAYFCAGYKLNNVNFTNFNIKCSTKSPALFAVNVRGDINVDGVDITGDLKAQTVSCYDMGLFFAWHYSGNTSIKNVNIDVQMRSIDGTLE